MMSLSSMTGFARADGEDDNANWYWELRSVNGRGLDVRPRLPAGFEQLDAKVRQLVSSHLKRGNVSVNLTLRRQAIAGDMQLNKVAVAQILSAATELRNTPGISNTELSADVVLNLRGVLETVEAEPTQQQQAQLHDAVLSTLVTALENLQDARRCEGARLAVVLGQHLDDIKKFVAQIEKSPARDVERIQDRLKNTVATLIATGQDLDPDRLHQEAVLLATRADVEEEIKRLHVHIAAAEELLASPDAVGRKFDFLAQEFNREANTICSKSNDAEITQAGLALKAVIDQLREQVQNIE